MRTASLRYCLSAIAVSAFPALVHASLGYSVKIEGAEVYRTEKLEPPPITSLGQGQALKLIHQGPAGSMVETEGGVKGWMRNGDLLAMENAPGGDFKLGNQPITGGGDPNISPTILMMPSRWEPEVFGLDRSFGDEIVEPMDREQVEMRHDEN